MSHQSPEARKQKKLPKYLVLQKKRGQTPLELLENLKISQPSLAQVPLSYAGRLDPMAEGKLLVLVGDECKKQNKYTDLDKEYEVTILLGAKTDTGDLLGLVANPDREAMPNLVASSNIDNVYILQRLTKAIRRELGSHSRKYPVFSSKTVNGKPLFLYALEGHLKEIQIPEHIETIYQISFLKRSAIAHSYLEKISGTELQAMILKALEIVPRSDEPSKELGQDFRQDAVRTRWEEFFAAQKTHSPYYLLHIRVICASGAYMRTLAERIGASLGMSALAFSINRTKIGRFQPIMHTSTTTIGFWRKLY